MSLVVRKAIQHCKMRAVKSAIPPRNEVQTGSRFRVSVVIPLYNHEKYIEAAIESVLAQTLRPAEIIIIDDGSIDGSAERVRKRCGDHPEIIFWSWPNQGAHHTLNAAILRATGDFVAILNSDDCFDPERLEACLAIVRSDPSVDVVATELSFIDDQGRPLENRWYEDALAFYKREGDLRLSLFHANFLVTTSNLFIRRALFERIGYFSPLRYTHDLEYCLRIISGQGKICFLDRRLLAYRLHGENTIAENGARVRVEQAAVYAFFIFRPSPADAANATFRSGLERYVEVLGKQQLLGMVEYFLRVLEERQQGQVLAFDSLPADFLRFLSRLGMECVGPGVGDPLQEHASRTLELAAELQARTEQRLAGQRDEWEKAKAHEERRAMDQALEEMRASNSWLAGQRDAWERAARANEEHVALNQALEEMRAGNAWLAGQRDAWEKAARANEEHIKALNQALEEMRAGNTWLAGQRDAWEEAAKTASEALARKEHELAASDAVVSGLLRSRLFRLLLRARLLKLDHVPGSTASD